MAEYTEMNMAELIRISNLVNQEICVPIGERVAAAARSDAETFSKSHDYQKSIGVVVDPRTGEKDWAHTYVVADIDYAYQVESRHGTLARALGGTT